MFLKQLLFAFNAYVISVGCLSTSQLCDEVSTFFPNFCDYPNAKQYCSNLCNNKTASTLKCGKNMENPAQKVRRRRIVGGEISSPTYWRWHASLRLRGVQECGASVLSQHFLLTAAHCVDAVFTSDKPRHFTVAVGNNHRTKPSDKQQILKVKRFFVPPLYKVNYYPRSNLYFVVAQNDLALIELEDPIQLDNNSTRSICLPDDRAPVQDNYECFIIGWGHTKFQGNASEEIRHAKIKTVPNNVCNEEKSFNNTVNPNMTICAGDSNATVSPCNKDSGGSLACKTNGTWHIHGIISSGYKCGGPHAYSLYTNVEGFKSWLSETMFTNLNNTASPNNSQKTFLNQKLILVIVLAMFALL